MGSKIERAWQYGRDLTAIAGTDVLLTSYPKSGNTWVKFLFFNYFQHYFGQEVNADFEKVNQAYPEIGLNQIRNWQPPFPGVPRIIKTHLKNNRFTRKARAIHIVRNPYDVMVSYWYYLQAEKRVQYAHDFQYYLRDPKYGLQAWLTYTQSWMSQHPLVIFYEDLRIDTGTCLQQMLDFLPFECNKESVAYAVESSSMKAMQAMESKSQEQHADRLSSSYKFVNDGGRKRWKDLAQAGDEQLMASALMTYKDTNWYKIINKRYQWE